MITLDITDNIAEVTLNAPEKMNALDEQAVAELGQAYTDAAEAGVRALLLRGEGRGFSAGRDISNVDPADDDAYDYLGKIVTPVLRQMAEFPAPTFAAVQGACLGVGLGLAIATDVVYVANDAKIGSPFANLGATLDSGGHALFTERLGAHRTLDLIYTAELMSGEDAVAQGLFSRAVPKDELLEFTRERVAKVAEGATGAFMASRKLVAASR
ncbi:MAG: enoyl-CoA hydratase/isomerase family protein, partial [Yaniella sp.]|nr:enoyl-CoA hydratase/isomerase family protein [Yaniella sp.]